MDNELYTQKGSSALWQVESRERSPHGNVVLKKTNGEKRVVTHQELASEFVKTDAKAGE
jgi:hypothetical protein